MAECATLFRPTARLRQANSRPAGKWYGHSGPAGERYAAQRELAKGFFASARPNMRLHAASRKNRWDWRPAVSFVAATVSVTRTDGRLGTARSTGPAAGLSFLVAMLFPLALSACRPVRLPQLISRIAQSIAMRHPLSTRRRSSVQFASTVRRPAGGWQRRRTGRPVPSPRRRAGPATARAAAAGAAPINVSIVARMRPRARCSSTRWFSALMSSNAHASSASHCFDVAQDQHGALRRRQALDRLPARGPKAGARRRCAPG